MRPTPTDGFLLLVPIKSTSRGKSRLGLDAALRGRLALAMALDTVTAAGSAARVRAVLALVEDDADGAALVEVGALVHRVSAVGLNESIAEGLRLPEAATGPVATLPADLPSLRPAELDAALFAAAAHPFAVVADRDGTGTTLLAAGSRERLFPRYGPGSLSAHLRAGAVLVEVSADSGLRRDVDLPADLLDASGPRTRRVLTAAADDGATDTGDVGDAGNTADTGDIGDAGSASEHSPAAS